MATDRHGRDSSRSNVQLAARRVACACDGLDVIAVYFHGHGAIQDRDVDDDTVAGLLADEDSFQAIHGASGEADWLPDLEKGPRHDRHTGRDHALDGLNFARVDGTGLTTEADDGFHAGDAEHR